MLRALRRRSKASVSVRPTLEALETRTLLSANVLQHNLVSDLQGVADFTDSNLKNPWGISESGGSPFWISDNNAGVSTLYNTPGMPQKLVVSIPTPGDPTGASGAPTGTDFNIALASGAFPVSNGVKSAPAIFLFATEDGTIVGWNPGINPVGSDPTKAGTFGTIGPDNSGNNFTEPDPAKQTGAVYKGLAIATDSSGNTLLYAANFRSGNIDVFGTDFKAPKPGVLAPAAFTDPDLPKGYAPFNVQELGGKIYVTYAKQNEFKHDDVAGHGKGFVDVYNLDGSGETRLVSRGDLNSPWGLAIAPPSFGSLAGSLLVGNFGDGRIHAYALGGSTPGKELATLVDPDGEPIAIDGLWALKVGNGGAGGDASKVYFTAGLDEETHGLFGSLTSVAPGTPEGPAEAQAVQANVDIFQLALTQVQNDLSSGVTGSALKQDLQALQTALINLIRSEITFAHDAARDAGLTGSGHHHHHDALDAVFGDHDDFMHHWD
jgi:uncharacterized protein (TIGR03118 family)